MLTAIIKKEINTFFSSLMGYIVIAVFLIATGLMLWVIPGQYNIIDAGYAHVDGLFVLAPWLFLFLCPAITMRAIAEERQNGTWDLLITRPVGVSRIVAGKFLASWLLVIIALLPTILFYISVYYIAEPFGNVDSGAFWGSFAGLILLAGIYVAIGIFASSLSKNQVFAFIMTLSASFLLFYGFELISLFFQSGSTILLIENLGIHAHYKSISRGVIDSRDLTYFFFMSGLFIFFTIRKLSIK
ncbi:MAG: gliding motility-associated ABC transporter permease subunit GldF [Paludibacter sp.]|nr:gliding motility-associated ABC transporter permease subunit GldF [Paludibacter sp.]MDD4199332.1 gliding motility-associated ABC transporter permease subunit GldF [Paludibacter sp.]MDD4427462.1 gliding motility-associated ABC transporter permease subunit GldF [Paludibacter sp.]